MSAECECCTDATPRLCLSCNDLDVRQAAAKERARIRRLIEPALRELLGAMRSHRSGMLFHPKCDHESCSALRAIDAATKPESKRRRVKKRRTYEDEDSNGGKRQGGI